MKKYNVILSLLLSALWINIILPAGKANIKIALVYPSLTKDILYKSTSFNPTEEWELLFLSQNYDYEMLDDADLDEVSTETSVVVVPSMEVVNKEILDAFKKLMDEGKGILITGNFGKYDENGAIRTMNIEDFPGFNIEKANVNDKLTVAHFLEGNTPISIGLQPGQKILLSATPELYYASHLAVDIRPEGGFIIPDNTFPGIITNAASSGRMCWLGFSLSQIIDKSRDKLIYNSLKWLSFQPEAFLNSSPGKYAFTVVLYKNIKDMDSSRDLVSVLQPVNYLISPSLLDRLKPHLKQTSRIFNLIATWDDFLFSQMKVEEKTDWLNRVRTDIKEITGQEYVGISIHETLDPKVYDLLKGAGYAFMFLSGYSDSNTFDYDSLSNLYLFYRETSGRSTLKILESGPNTGGTLCIEETSAGSNLDSLLSESNCWITTFSDIIDWAEKSKHLIIHAYHSEGGNYEINIKNDHRYDIQNAGLWVSIPYLKKRIPVSFAGQEFEMTFDNLKKMYFLNLNKIGGYQEISFTIPVN